MDDSANMNVRDEGLNYYSPRNDENALKIRLETEDSLERIEMYLKGESYAYNDRGELIKIVNSEPKANDKGVRAIMSAISSYINRSSVQGNLTDQEVGMVMNDYHRGMANLLGFHCDEWEINRNERKTIVNFIEPFVFMFVSRTKNNLERESYGMTIKQTGTQVLDNRSKGFGLFKS